MRYLILFIAVSSFLACGPSRAQLEYNERTKMDSIRQADSISGIVMADSAMNEESGSHKPVLRGGVAYWSTSETGLPAGVVYDFAPQNEEDPEYNPSGPFYVVVRTLDGKLVSTETDHKLWASMRPNQIIK